MTRLLSFLVFQSFYLKVEECGVEEVCEDADNKIVTTPAFMFDGKAHEVHDGIALMVNHVIGLI